LVRYDYERIERMREEGHTWPTLARIYGAPSTSTLRSSYYKWRSRQQGQQQISGGMSFAEAGKMAEKIFAISPPDNPTAPPAKQKKPEPFIPPPAYLGDDPYVLTARPDNTIVIGVASDRHIGSKYHREDVLQELYRRFAEKGVDAVIDCGNYIDGDARFNKHDVLATGIDRQLTLMAEQTPRMPSGVPTYAIWGDDHEGWYAQREGINVGEYAENKMQRAGHQWWDLGFMEAHMLLRNANSGAESRMAVMHPGGGSAYAHSYKPQKIVESMEGGEKPAVLLIGHYHKMSADNIRNVWVAQTGTCEDQTPFMRKKSLEAHVGGMIITLEQDPRTGAIIGFDPYMIRYFNRRYYNQQWSLHGDVRHPDRTR
jgi:predicted phosphodiesterase